MAMDDTFPPMEYRNDKNELVGFDVDFGNAIAKERGVKAEFKPTAWDGILPEAVGAYYKKAKPDAFDVLEESFGQLPTGIAVRKGDAKLEKELAKAIQTLKDNGTFAKISIKWFGKDKSNE
ncbi:hypothetical protein BIV60_08195 [Bacillus sp. MUM 116]|nr:hypothetical protein BIV60_08195 [Bacillus sp. MUM 116]